MSDDLKIAAQEAEQLYEGGVNAIQEFARACVWGTDEERAAKGARLGSYLLALRNLATVPSPVAPEPIDMVLHCPKCGLQHIDRREFEPGPYGRMTTWDNPPHRSHLCHGCGHIWRPADVPTNGVAAVKTKGKADSPIATPAEPLAPGGVPSAVRIALENFDSMEPLGPTTEALIDAVQRWYLAPPAPASEAPREVVLPELPYPSAITEGRLSAKWYVALEHGTKLYTADQLRAYGKQCAEAGKTRDKA